MKIEEFIEVITQMENFYQKELTEEQRNIWYDNVKSMGIIRFRYIIANLFKTCKFIPKLADVFELNISLGTIPTKNEEPTTYCKKCRNTGYILYKQIVEEHEYEFAAICSCNRKKQYKGWEISDERYRSKYYTPLAVELGID